MPGLAGITSAVLQRRSRHSARRCFITCLLLLASSFSASAQYGWTGTWASAPLAGKPNPTLAGKTLRQIIHTSVSGTSIRVRISNVFGDQPLRIEDVHIAIPSTGGSIVPVTDRQLRFQHRSFEVIPPGASVLSDALRFELPALSDVAISLYLPSVPGTITWHPSAHRISYMARGDRSGAADLPNAERTGSCYFLTGVDVQGTGLRGSVVTLGASITEGYKATDGMNREWPAVLAQRLTVAHIGLGVLNEGISGNRLLHPGAGPDAGSRFQSDVLDQTGVRWVIFSDDPINDLGSTQPPPTLNQLISATEELIAAAHRRHIRFYCSTLTPFEGADYWTAAEETIREQFNGFIRSTASGCDAVVDQDRATHDPDHPTRFLPAYDSGDHLHPNDAGHRAIADAIDLSLFRQNVSVNSAGNIRRDRSDRTSADRTSANALTARAGMTRPTASMTDVAERSRPAVSSPMTAPESFSRAKATIILRCWRCGGQRAARSFRVAASVPSPRFRTRWVSSTA